MMRAEVADAPPRGRVAILDGLRALAIGAVLAHHAGFAPGGGIGVTVFFVLSGFLITGLLTGPGALTFAGLKRFYWRRTMRLLPALVCVCTFCLLWALLALDGQARHLLLTEVLTSITYTQDFYLGHGSSTADFGYLGHTWSLAIEQQFYFAWPLLLIAIVRLAPGRRQAIAYTALLALAFALWRAHLASRGLNAHIGLNLDAQADSLLVGCCLALAMPALRGRLPAHQRVLDAGAAITLLLIAVMSESHLNRATPGRVGYLLVAVGTALLICRLLTPPRHVAGRLMARAFSLRPIVWIGLISYSIYLWHPVILRIAKEDIGLCSRPEQVLGAPLLLAVILLVSWLSFVLVEVPFQRLRNTRMPDPNHPLVPYRPEPQATTDVASVGSLGSHA
jgi:peptidoglycan/LPS O-acetylase OafA/YrhL